jgi:hypothetical protein
MELTERISARVLLGTAVITLLMAQLVTVFSFWPMRVTIEALFITTVFYSLVGMTQQHIVERPYPKTAREFLAVIVLVFILVLTTTKWGQGIQ